MKSTKLLLGAAVAGAMFFAAGTASAFPLKLTALSGTFTVTPSYSALAGSYGVLNTNVAKATTASFNLKTMMIIITNQVFLNSGTTPPAGSYVVYDPYWFTTYLTNSAGYYYDLGASNIVTIYTDNMATTFKGGSNGGGTETDVTTEHLYVNGYGPDGLYYEGEIYGLGSLKYSDNGKNKIAMTIACSGAGYGEYKSSADGVTKGSFTFTGASTLAEWVDPYPIYWWYEWYE